MGNITVFLKKILGTYKYDTKILVLGLAACGKTTMMYRMKLGEIIQSVPTIGFNVEKMVYNNM